MLDRIEIVKQIENERKRIAGDIHDTTVQELVSLSQQLELCLHYIDKDEGKAKDELVNARNHVKDIISDIRDVIYNLRPMSFDDLGWDYCISKLKDELKGFNKNTDVIFNIGNIADDTNHKHTDDNILLSVYRIIRELSINVLKHAEADTLYIGIKLFDDYINISVIDNGVGFDEYNNTCHFGISFVKERVELLNGTIKIDSDSAGTKVYIDIPV